MRTQIKNNENVAVRSTNRFGSLGFAMVVALIAFAFSAFTFGEKPTTSLTQVCFEFTGADNPSDALVTNPSSYSAQKPSLTCLTTPITLCGMCFDTADFPLDAAGKPMFIDEDNVETPLGKLVRENKANTTEDGQEIIADNGEPVTIHFRSEK